MLRANVGPLMRAQMVLACLAIGLLPWDAKAIVQAPEKHATPRTGYKGVRSPVHPRYYWPDERRLEQYAAVWNVDAKVAKAMAWQESGANMDRLLRGHQCWYKRTVVHRFLGYFFPDTVVVIHHESDCEVGRFQIKPSTAARSCRGVNIFTREGNYQCFFKVFSEASSRHGTEAAIREHNGRGPMTVAYLASVKRIVRGVIWDGRKYGT